MTLGRPYSQLPGDTLGHDILPSLTWLIFDQDATSTLVLAEDKINPLSPVDKGSPNRKYFVNAWIGPITERRKRSNFRPLGVPGWGQGPDAYADGDRCRMARSLRASSELTGTDSGSWVMSLWCASSTCQSWNCGNS